jgi:hypothetical protein
LVHGADGQGGITGALAALSTYFTHNQKHETDCGYNFGWNFANAPRSNPKAVNNIAACAKTGR